MKLGKLFGFFLFVFVLVVLSEAYATWYTIPNPMTPKVKVSCADETARVWCEWDDDYLYTCFDECPLYIAIGETATFSNDGSHDEDRKVDGGDRLVPDGMKPVEWSLYADGEWHYGSGSLSYTFNEPGYYEAGGCVDDMGQNGDADDGIINLSPSVDVLPVDYVIVLPNPGVCAPLGTIVFTGHAYNNGPNGERDLDDYGNVIPEHTDDDIKLGAVFEWTVGAGDTFGTVNPSSNSASTTFTAAETAQGSSWISATYIKMGVGNYVTGSADVNVSTACSIDGAEPNMGGIPPTPEDEIDFDVTITGTFGTTISSVGFGSGISVNSFTRDSSTQITANIRIYYSTSRGYRDISVTSDGIEYIGEDMFLVVRNLIEYSWNPVQLGAKETILYADGNRTTVVTSYVTRDNDIPVQGVEVTFSIEEGNGSVNPETANTDDDGKATATLTSANATGTTIVKAVAATSGKSRAKVYMYRQKVKNPNIYYDFNEIISNNDMTNTPANLNTQQEIEAWLENEGSGLADMKYPEDPPNQLISEIIHNAGQANNINVQVILVTLQKEKGLISNQTPTQAQLNHAMGYGINPSNIKHQIEAGTACFKNHYNSAPGMPYLFPKGTAGGTGIGYYVEETEERVGVRVKICNKATYALYKYTPWIRYTSTSGGNLLFYILWVQYDF